MKKIIRISNPVQILRVLLCCFGAYLLIRGLIESQLLDGQIIEKQIYLILYTVGTLLFLGGIFFPRIRKAAQKSIPVRLISFLLCGVLLFLFATAGLIVIWPIFAPKADGSEPVMLVMGAPVIDDKPSIILHSREDAASKWAEKHPETIVVIAGGKGGTKTESEVIADQMEADGIDPNRLVMEKSSTTTEENLSKVKEMLGDSYDVTEEPVAVLSNQFHMYRLHCLLNRQGYRDVHYIMVPTPHSVRLLWYTREVVLIIRFWVTGIA